jgi:hypothetical protein
VEPFRHFKVTAKDDLIRLLSRAAWAASPEIVSDLLSLGADPNAIMDRPAPLQEVFSRLRFAADGLFCINPYTSIQNCLKVLELLCTAGAKANLSDRHAIQSWRSGLYALNGEQLLKISQLLVKHSTISLEDLRRLLRTPKIEAAVGTYWWPRVAKLLARPDLKIQKVKRK